jgi:hypothetical protein
MIQKGQIIGQDACQSSFNNFLGSVARNFDLTPKILILTIFAFKTIKLKSMSYVFKLIFCNRSILSQVSATHANMIVTLISAMRIW